MTIDMEFDDTPSRQAAAEHLHASVFLEAGAGTGKSTTLVSRIVNTITSDLDVDILQIAAITFTERAGAELRHRLRERLTQDLAKDPENEQLASALRSLDSATVGTIHSFAQRILRTHALSARLPLGFTVATGAEQLQDKRQRARAVIEHWVDTLPPGIIDTLASYGHSPVDLVPLIEALDEASLRLAPSAFEPGRLINTPRLCEQVADSFSALLRDAERACSNSDDMLLNVMRASIPPLITLLRACDDDALIDEWRSIHDHHAVFTLGRGGAPTAWSGGTPAEWKARVKSLEPVLMSCLMAPLENAIRQALAVGWQVFAAARDYRASEGVIDFDGLLSRARDLLAGDREVRAQVHDEYRVLLVDEFQDTDPVQWELIRLITSDPDDSTKRPLPGRLIVVGDPKQAIYGFRGADIDTYRAALRLFSDATDPLGEVHPLVTNFRSVAPLLDWVNATFSRGMAGAPNQVAYAPLAIRHDPEHDAPGPAIVVLRDPEPVPDPTNPDKTLTISSMTLEPRLAAQEIARAIDSAWQVTDRDTTGGRAYVRQARFSDVAILYPARTGVDNLLEALDEAGVPYRSGDASLVFRRPCVAGLLAAVAVIDDPSRELDLWLALKSPLFGCGDDDLLRHRRAEGRWSITAPSQPSGRVGAAMAVLREVRYGSDAPQPVTTIDNLLHRSRLIEALSYAPRGAFDTDCLRMVRAHAQQWQDDGGVGLSDYLAAAQEAQTPASRASLPEPDDRDDNAVRLLTVYQAKGLEFPIVALAGMSHEIYDPAPTIAVVARDHVEFSLSGIMTSAGFQAWNEGVRIPSANAERMRLAYVACTRARDHLIVSVCGEQGTASPAHASLLWDAVLADASDVTAVNEPVDPRLVERLAPPPPLPEVWPNVIATLRDRSREPSVVSPSGAAAMAFGLDLGGSGDSSTGPIGLMPTEGSSPQETRAARDGRPLGRAVHAALDALVAHGGMPDTAAIAGRCSEAADAEGIPSQSAEVTTRVTAALETELMRRALAAPRRWSELYLAAPVESGPIEIVEGFADLVFAVDDGLVLVDYKTDEHLTNESMLHYREQLASYAELLNRATGQPVVERVVLHVPGNSAAVIDCD